MFIGTSQASAILTDLLGLLPSTTSSHIFTSNRNCWLGLYTTLPSSTGSGGVEPSTSNNYARVEISQFMTVTGRTAKNTQDINFSADINPSDPTDTSHDYDWGPILGFGLFVSRTASAPYAWGTIDPAVTVEVQTTPHFLKEKFNIEITDSGSLTASVGE